MLGLGRALAVVAGHLGDELDLPLGEAGEVLGVADHVVGVQVVPLVGDDQADVGEQGRRLEQLAELVAEAVAVGGLVEEARGRGAAAWRPWPTLVGHQVGQVAHAGGPDVAEVVERGVVVAAEGVEQQALPQGVVGDDQRLGRQVVHELLQEQGPAHDDVGPLGVEARDGGALGRGGGVRRGWPRPASTSSAADLGVADGRSGASPRRASAISAMLRIVPELPTATSKPWRRTSRTTGAGEGAARSRGTPRTALVPDRLGRRRSGR